MKSCCINSNWLFQILFIGVLFQSPSTQSSFLTIEPLKWICSVGVIVYLWLPSFSIVFLLKRHSFRMNPFSLRAELTAGPLRSFGTHRLLAVHTVGATSEEMTDRTKKMEVKKDGRPKESWEKEQTKMRSSVQTQSDWLVEWNKEGKSFVKMTFNVSDFLKLFFRKLFIFMIFVCGKKKI